METEAKQWNLRLYVAGQTPQIGDGSRQSEADL